MTCQVFILDLKDDPRLIAQYEAWHARGKVPVAVSRSIRSRGISNMEIFRSGNRLVMLVENGAIDLDDAPPADDAAVIAWEALMDRFQQRIAWAEPGQKWVPAKRIFSLEEQG